MVDEPQAARSHPDRVRNAGRRRRGEVRPAGVPEVAEPLPTRRDLALEHLEDVVADDLGAAVDVAQHLAARGGVGEGHVRRLQPPEQRAPSRPVPAPAAVEPHAARMLAGDLGEEPLDAGTHEASRKFATSAAPCSDSTDSGWNCTPASGSVRCRTPMTTPSDA